MEDLLPPAHLMESAHERNAREYGFQAHRWDYGIAVRECWRCHQREAYWDDFEFPLNPCKG